MTNRAPSRSSDVPLRRVEAYSDGVFAIAATLLVLGVSAPAIGAATSDQELWSGLKEQRTAFLGIVVAFLVLCNLWSIQARQLGSLTQTSDRYLTYNALRLLGVILVPFTTSVATNYDDLTIGRLLLPLNILWITVVGVVSGWHARSARLFADERVDRRSRRWWGVFHIGLAAAVVVLAPFVGMWAFLLFAFEGLLMRLFGLSKDAPFAG